jgi:UDP-N-acetylglucosamine/UDP-N-acetylgalactosamine diphosphorylase
MKSFETFDEHEYDEPGNRRRVVLLQSYGVKVWGPERVYIGPEVSLENINPGTVLKNAVLTGQSTFIGTDTIIGSSGLAVLHNCQVGDRVRVGAGHYDQVTLLADSKTRGFAELRPGTLLEEEAEIGHNVGLKHTILTVGVVVGSSINFCDVLTTGGTARDDHTEIGSGVVHFNFDPRGDKFGSLLGDARGVLLRSPRIFVGGNSGLIAPLHVDFGAVIAAGSTVRRDVEMGKFLVSAAELSSVKTSDPTSYFDLRRKFIRTAELIGNLRSLTAWYEAIRLPFSIGKEGILLSSALAQIRLHITHRIKELDKVMSKVAKEDRENPFYDQHRKVAKLRTDIRALLADTDCLPSPPGVLVSEYETLRSSHSHCDTVRMLSAKACGEAHEWLMHMPLNMVRGMAAAFDC